MSRTTEQLRESQIAQATPLCPRCNEPLVFRGAERRFPEDHRYQECVNSHVWVLSDPREPMISLSDREIESLLTHMERSLEMSAFPDLDGVDRAAASKLLAQHDPGPDSGLTTVREALEK